MMLHLGRKFTGADVALINVAPGTVLRPDVCGQLGLKPEHGLALLSLALEVGQVLQ